MWQYAKSDWISINFFVRKPGELYWVLKYPVTVMLQSLKYLGWFALSGSASLRLDCQSEVGQTIHPVEHTHSETELWQRNSLLQDCRSPKLAKSQEKGDSVSQLEGIQKDKGFVGIKLTAPESLGLWVDVKFNPQSMMSYLLASSKIFCTPEPGV